MFLGFRTSKFNLKQYIYSSCDKWTLKDLNSPMWSIRECRHWYFSAFIVYFISCGAIFSRDLAMLMPPNVQMFQKNKYILQGQMPEHHRLSSAQDGGDWFKEMQTEYSRIIVASAQCAVSKWARLNHFVIAQTSHINHDLNSIGVDEHISTQFVRHMKVSPGVKCWNEGKTIHLGRQ